MIKKVEISNFQSHKNTVIQFSNKLNCIIGSTHVGKSALVRALRWVLYNDQFKDFITWGENLCSVSVHFDNDVVVTREREKNTNRYILKKDNKTEIFESFGLDVPPKIKAELGTTSVVLSESQSFNLNIRSQHDPLFLLTETGTTRAKSLNSLIGVHIIDEALKGLVADGKKEKILSSEIKEEIVSIEDEIKSFGDLTARELVVKKLQFSLLSLKKMVEIVKNLKEFVDSCNDFEGRVKEHEEKQKNIKIYDFNKILKLDKYCLKYKECESVLNELIYFFNREKDLNIRKNNVVKYDVEKIKNADSLVSKRKEFLEFNVILSSFENEMATYFKTREHTEKILRDKKQSYSQFIKKLGKCPLCYSDIDDKKVCEIVRSL